MTTFSEDILAWSTERPKWLRDALRRIIAGTKLTDDDIRELADICEATHGLHEPVSIEPLAAEHVAPTPVGQDPTQLRSITHHHGVNALAQEQTLTFGNNLTVVYGQNAAGKSGYTRILKSVCRSRSTGPILGNVLNSSAPLKPSATICYEVGGAKDIFTWQPGTAAPAELARVSVFDSQCAPIYLREKNDVAFRPAGLDVFDKLSDVCGKVRLRIESDRAILVPASRPLPVFPEKTSPRTLIDHLSVTTKESQVLEVAALDTEQRERLDALRKRRQDLQAADPKALARDLNLRAGRFDSLARHLLSVKAGLGKEFLAEIRNLEDQRRSAAIAAAESRSLPAGLLPETGGPKWREVWRAAQEFSVVALPGRDFPFTDTGAVCPLCQQPLSADAGERFRHFAAYFDSAAQLAFTNASSKLESAIRAVLKTVIWSEDIRLTIAELGADRQDLEQAATTFLDTASTLQVELQQFASTGALPATGVSETSSSTISTLASQLRERAAQLVSNAQVMSPDEVAVLVELEARDAFQPHVATVLGEIDRLRRQAAVSACIDETSTTAITKKSTELTKAIVTDALRNAFQEELQKLQFDHLLVEIKFASGTKGAAYHQLAFTNAPGAPVADVLSEGEARTLSLAAFLTELTTATSPSGIIFDDPVSSLDHVWREKIARRLVAEAKVRQVIVFTHDLLFLRYLVNESSRQGVICNHQQVERTAYAGVTSSDLPWLAMGTKQRVGALRNRWQTAEKIYRTCSSVEYESEAREIYRMLRQAWEQGVSEILLNDVVERYRHSIETQKVKVLIDISDEDCKTVEQEMTECSRLLHDEPAAEAVPLPKPDNLKERIDALDAWVKKIQARRKT